MQVRLYPRELNRTVTIPQAEGQIRGFEALDWSRPEKDTANPLLLLSTAHVYKGYLSWAIGRTVSASRTGVANECWR